MSNPLLDLQKCGQSVWYDTISRGMITSGELQRLIAADGVRGVTSNPAIFEKAIAGSSHYNGALGHLAESGQSPVEIYETIAVEDIQWGADLLLPVYEGTGGSDGFISLEVSPHLARDTQASIDEALRLATAVGRPNLMIKIPGTPEGVPAVEHLIGEGLNINITLLFSRRNYVEIVDAYMSGLEKLLSRGGDPASDGQCRELLCQPHRYPGRRIVWRNAWKGHLRPEAEELRRSSRQDRRRQRQAGLPTVRRTVRRRNAGAPWRLRGREPQRSAVGEHQHKKSRIPRRDVRRRAGWSRHGKHHARGDT